MLFPRPVAAPAKLPGGAGDGPTVAEGPAVAGGAEDDPADGGTAAETAFGGLGAEPGCAVAVAVAGKVDRE